MIPRRSTALLLACLAWLPSCNLFKATNVAPQMQVNELRNQNFTEFYDATVSLVAGSQLDPATKTTLLSKMKTFEQREASFYHGTLAFLSELGKFGAEDWKLLYERSLKLVEDLRAK